MQAVAEEELAVVCLLCGVVRMPLDSGWTQGRADASGACDPRVGGVAPALPPRRPSPEKPPDSSWSKSHRQA